MIKLDNNQIRQISGGTEVVGQANQIELFEVVVKPGVLSWQSYVNPESGNSYRFTHLGSIIGPDGPISPFEYHTHTESGNRVFIGPSALLA